MPGAERDDEEPAKEFMVMAALAERFDEESDETLRRIDRRAFLRGAGVAGIGLVLVSNFPATASASTPGPVHQEMAAYRLSTRGAHACNACKAHGAHRYFSKPRFARRHRAHAGCNCKILAQQLPQTEWRRYFVQRDGTRRDEWDTRW